MITAKEITNGYLIQFRDGGSNYYRGMCAHLLEKTGFTFDSVTNFLGHPDVQGWTTEFVMGQTMMMISGIRDVRIHDVTLATLQNPKDFSDHD